jgi:cytochrome b involved in lipid metabolism
MAARVPTPKFSRPSGLKDAKHLPKQFKLRRYYTPKEVSAHNTADDCWVSFFDEVYDLSKLIQDNFSAECEPIIKAAGQDITHWFDAETHEPRTWVDSKTNMTWYYTPFGRYLHIPPIEPDSSWDPSSFKTPWWKDRTLCIGRLTLKTRKLRIINMLTKDDDIIEVCSEETMNEILDRYMPSNEHSASYTWKRLGRPLDMEVTLEDNDIPDETVEFVDLHIDEDAYIACVHLYYNDDLTVA